jgi:ribose transport system permease protein
LTTQTQFLNGVSHAQSIVQRVGVVWFAVILLYAVSGLFSPGMFQVSQVLNILQVAAFLGVVAAGQTLALLTGGIDLSVAGVVTMANIVSTSIMAGRDGNMFMAVATCILLAATVGLINVFVDTDLSDDELKTLFKS